MIRTGTVRRLPLSSFLLSCVIVLIAASPSAAQSGDADARWHAWVGCWTAVPERAYLSDAASRQACVIHAAGHSAADVLFLVGGQIEAREHIEATGLRRARERDGCRGWERAQWSADGRRVYLQSEDDCPGGLKRNSTGLLAMSRRGEWLNITGITVGKRTGARVVRYRAAGVTTGLPTEIASALAGFAAPATEPSRTAAASSVGMADIVEASRWLDAAVVQAWLNEIGQTFSVDAKRLIELADAGVPDRVIDVMVALSYPATFVIKPSSTPAGLLEIDLRSRKDCYSQADYFACAHLEPIDPPNMREPLEPVEPVLEPPASP